MQHARVFEWRNARASASMASPAIAIAIERDDDVPPVPLFSHLRSLVAPPQRRSPSPALPVADNEAVAPQKCSQSFDDVPVPSALHVLLRAPLAPARTAAVDADTHGVSDQEAANAAPFVEAFDVLTRHRHEWFAVETMETHRRAAVRD